MSKESFLQNRIRSIQIALKGMIWLLRNESSIKIQCAVAFVVTCAGFYFDISTTEWMLQWLSIGLVMGIEGLNTAIEKLSDYIQPRKDPKIGFVKDLSAGAVMLVAFIASIVGLVIYIPKLF